MCFEFLLPLPPWEAFISKMFQNAHPVSNVNGRSPSYPGRVFTMVLEEAISGMTTNEKIRKRKKVDLGAVI